MASLSAKRSYDDDDSTLNIKEKKKHTNSYLTYDILRVVFKYLNWVDLMNASLVCRSWLEAANDEKRTREGPISLLNNGKRCVKIVEKLWNKPTLGLVFKGILKRSIRQGIYLNYTSAFSNFKLNVSIKCIYHSAFNHHVWFCQDCLCQVLPHSCEIVTLSTFGVLINNAEMENAYHQKVYAFLPKIPDVRMKVIKIVSQDDFTEYHQQIRLSFVRHKINDSKCLLIFCNQAGRGLAQRTARILQLSNRRIRPSVWGGVVKDLYLCNSKNRDHDDRCFSYALCVAIIIIGAIDSWSIVLDGSCNTKGLVERKLESFKNNISLRKHSIGYMFACCERGTNMFNERNVESTIFRKLFPGVPLVGCFGDGEFGEDTISSKSPNFMDDYWYHERSTVFLIITYGKKLT